MKNKVNNKESSLLKTRLWLNVLLVSTLLAPLANSQEKELAAKLPFENKNDKQLIVEIFEIQGQGLSSPYNSKKITTHDNVVTALTHSGFFMQTPTQRSDGNIETSDGVYVFTQNKPSVAIGDMVTVVGKVVEFKDFTQFAVGALVTITSSNNPLPEVITLDENTVLKTQPLAINALERFESMLVTFKGIVTGPTDKYGDAAVVVGNNRAFREPGILYPGKNGLPIFDGNAEIFEISPDALSGKNVELFVGQQVFAFGPLAYSFGDYQVWPTALTIGEQPTILNRVRDKTENEMTVGSLNMYRPSQIADKYEVRLAKLSQFVRTVMNSPDILAVSEVDNLVVLKKIADKINKEDNKVNYRPYLVEGNDYGGIDVGFLVRDTVETDQIVQLGKSTQFTYEGKSKWLNDRPPLLFKGRMKSASNDFPIQVLVVHNRSLNKVDTSERVRAKRLAQAQFVANAIQTIQSKEANVNLVVTGDFNAYQFSDGYVDVLGQITGTAVKNDNLLWQPSPVSPQLTNQVSLLNKKEQYSFVYQGSAQVLDHILTSQHLTPFVNHVVYARGNADAPAALVNDGNNAMRSSDHDGIVMFIKVK